MTDPRPAAERTPAPEVITDHKAISTTQGAVISWALTLLVILMIVVTGVIAVLGAAYVWDVVLG